ncbi:RING finger protein nhl-1-like [Athalia rosae]|uniref:RING finger protein nhl-1-like n=1 Tax=Athalia rosae TaxID=37344 RepID=UPI002033BA87|nr:RING finger protein nhl-1-like [Athalia rosae]
MSSKFMNIFKKQHSNLSHRDTSPVIVGNYEESSAIMQEMTEIPTDFILGPIPSTSKSTSSLTASRSNVEGPTNAAVSEKIKKRPHRTSLGAIEDLLQCPVCLERLRTPRMMPCQHTFCLSCLEEQLVWPGNDNRSIACPLCKLTVVECIPRNLPTNLYIENLLRVLDNSGEKLDHLGFTSPVITFASIADQPSFLVQEPSSYISVPEPSAQETRCVICSTTCDRDRKCKHCKQVFCSVCWVAHMDELKEQLTNISDQLSNTTVRFEHRIEDFKIRAAQLTEYIDRDIEVRISELQQERNERIKRAEESTKKGEKFAEDLKGKIIKAQEEVMMHKNFKFDTLADNQEKVKTFLALHRRASDLMAAVALWGPELTDSAIDERDDKQRLDFSSTEENAWFYYRSRQFTPKVVVGRGIVQRPAGIAVDPWKKHLLIACPGTRQVLVLDKKYRVHRRIQHQDMMSPQGVAFLEDFEEIYVTDKWKHCIHVFNRKGDLLRRICSKGQGDGQLRSPEGIAAHPSRNLLYVADTGNDRIQILTPDGASFGFIGLTGKSETTLTKSGLAVSSNVTFFNQPTAVAVSETMIVVADCANHKIKIFDHDSNLLRTIGTPGSHRGLLRTPETVALDPKGNVIVGDSGNARIQIFSASGELLRVLGSKGFKEGQFGWVSGILIKDNLEIVVSDGKNYTVQVF